MTTESEFHDEVRAHLAYFAELLPPEYKLTLVARHTEMPPGAGDIMITDDQPDAVIRAIEHLKTRDPHA